MPRRMLVIAAAAAALTALAIPTADQPLARWLFERDTHSAIWDDGISVLEYAGGIEPWRWLGIYVLGAGVVLALAVPRWHRHARVWMTVALVHLLSRNAIFWLKPLTGRLRPYEWITRGGDTFFRDGGYSFPSGHVALFASLALPLAVAVPRLRVAAAIVVGYVMVARVMVDAHFLSDVTGALAMVCLFTAACAPLLGAATIRPSSPR
jgi:membrane-associated phospholipid phosphatase